jgi:hypothetical protein
METIRVEVKMSGETKIIWVTLGSGKDLETMKFAIDAAFDKIEDRHNTKSTTSDLETTKVQKKHKRHLFTKRCRYCNLGRKGGTGLSSHERACVKKQTPEDLKKVFNIEEVS